MDHRLRTSTELQPYRPAIGRTRQDRRKSTPSLGGTPVEREPVPLGGTRACPCLNRRSRSRTGQAGSERRFADRGKNLRLRIASVRAACLFYRSFLCPRQLSRRCLGSSFPVPIKIINPGATPIGKAKNNHHRPGEPVNIDPIFMLAAILPRSTLFGLCSFGFSFPCLLLTQSGH